MIAAKQAIRQIEYNEVDGVTDTQSQYDAAFIGARSVQNDTHV